MGCTASKPVNIVSKNPEDFSNSSPPVPRTLSLPMSLVHHPPTKKGDTHHLVSLTSTTYGSLILIEPSDQKDPNFNCHECPPNLTKRVNQTELDQSLSPDSVINTWELMDGLEDEDEDDDQKSIFDDTPMDASKKPSSCTVLEENYSSPSSSLPKKPLWQHLSEETLLAKLDPNVAWSYLRALSSRKLGNKGVRSMGSSSPLSCSSFSINEDKIVVYFTSLRGIRKTYEDCCSVRMILRGYRVAVDEKDISMDSSYRKELQNAIGGKTVTLPMVFIRGKYVGNAEEIKLLNESGELANLLKGFPILDHGFVCETCGDARFVPCSNCNGSRKVFEGEQGELRRCQDCNENGLIRCPACCS
ncbi:uncharacterized protein At5g39865-like [Gastrolobium bilobum]|uniref:uncharacterized protein At5g39865-like n=1 Tax=Gastrolobium bilobum TaxID=150636 RepID=UPI002AB15F86|nr:uncharacterized protein At5g39865-like [Gastrolobium bilobum]